MCSVLTQAIPEGDIDLVRDHLETNKIGFSSSVLNSHLNTAFDNKDVQMVKLLLKYGADPNLLLYKAVLQREYMIIQEMINYGANVNQNVKGSFNTHYYFPSVRTRMIPLICHAILNNDESIALLLLRYSADINATDSEGDSVLSYALHMKMRYLATVLISMGCDINARNNDNYTVLHVAAMSHLTGVTIILFNNKADESHPQGKTLLHLAIASYNEDYSPTVLDDHADDIMDFFDELISRGCDVNAQDNLGNTPLHEILNKLLCVANRDIAWIIRRLISAGADVTLKGENGLSPVLLIAQMLRQNTYMAVSNVSYFDPVMWQVVWQDLTDNKRISEEDRNFIKSLPMLKKYIEDYEMQVAEMRRIKFNGISIADFFLTDIKKIDELVCNPKIARAFRTVNKSKLFPSFADQVQRVWGKSEKRRDLLELLISIFYRYLPMEIIFKVAKYVNN